MTTDHQAVYGVQTVQNTADGRLRKRAIANHLTAENVRFWGSRAICSFLDQGFISVAGLGVNLLLARWLAAELYGAFAVAFAAFLFIAGAHNVLLLEPMSVFGPARYPARLPEYFRTQIRIHILLVGSLSILGILTSLVIWLIAPVNPLVGAIVGGSLALPLILFQWLARRMCYVVQQPAIAVAGSGLYLVTTAVGLLALFRFGWLGPFSAFLLMGFSGLLAASILMRSLGVFSVGKTGESKVSWTSSLRDNWGYGRWLLGSTALYSASIQVQTFLVASLLGLGAAGVLRAMQIPSLVMVQIVTAVGLLILPVFSYDFGNNGAGKLWAIAAAVGLVLCAAALGFAGFLWFFAQPLEHAIFGGKYYDSRHLMAVLGLIPVSTGASIGYSMALRAIQKPKFDLLANIVAAPIGLGSALVLIPKWGVLGAAVSMVLASFVSALVVFLCASRWRNPTARPPVLDISSSTSADVSKL